MKLHPVGFTDVWKVCLACGKRTQLNNNYSGSGLGLFIKTPQGFMARVGKNLKRQGVQGKKEERKPTR